MTQSLLESYMENVLGWKTVPSTPAAPQIQSQSQSQPATTRSLFGLYVEDLNPQDQALLDKMMIAIGVSDYVTFSDPAQILQFDHVLNFSEKDLNSAGDVKIWRFGDLSSYSSGPAHEVTKRKREAWELLQTFKKEVL